MILKNLVRKLRAGSYQGHSMFMRFIVTYVVILTIPLLTMGVLVYRDFVSAMTRDVEKSTVSSLRQVMDLFDMWMKELNYIVSQISRNKNITPMIFSQNVKNFSEYDFYMLSCELQNYRATNTFIDHIYLYFRKGNVVVGSEGKYDDKIFLDHVYRRMQGGQAEIQSILSTLPEKRVIPSEPVKVDDNTVRNYISFLFPLPYPDKLYSATLMATMDANNVDQLAKDVLGDHQGNIFVLDERNHVITSVSNGEYYFDRNQVVTLVRPQSRAVYDLTVNKRNLMVTMLRSEKTGWSFIAVIPSKQIFSQVNNMKNLAVVVIVICLAIGISLAYFFSYGNYHPIKNIIKMLMENSSSTEKKGKSKNELVQISTAFMELINKDKEMQRRLQQYVPVVRTNFLMRLLLGNYSERREGGSFSNLLGVELGEGPYVVMIFNIDDYDKLVRDNSEDAQSLIRFSISNVAEELSQDLGRGYTVEMSCDKVVLIMDFSGNREDADAKAAALGHKTREFFEEYFHITLTVGIGRCYPMLMDISKSYMEALSAVEYKMIRGKNTVIPYEQIVNAGTERYYYTMKHEEKIIDYIKTGNWQGISEVLSNIVGHITESSTSISVARCVYYGLINTAMKAVFSLDHEIYTGIAKRSNILNDLLNCQTLKEVYDQTAEFYKSLCKSVEMARQNRAKYYRENILAYVRENYTDVNLSLAVLSDKFAVTPTFLSRLFKKETGENFVEYVHKMRIKKAKQLLVSSDKSISSIAAETGFFNSHGFIRAFKKLEGTTPGNFRQMHGLK